jgi:hypothetical protein
MSAHVRVLPFDARNKVRPKHGGKKISSPEDLVDALKQSKGDPDKPVRLVVDQNGMALVAKFGFGDDPLRQPLVEDEIRNHRVLRDAHLATPHIAELKWAGEGLKACVSCTEYIEPLGDCHTLRELAQRGTDAQWRQALFQTLFSLACLQQTFPGFRHNDLKGDNVLVTRPTKAEASYAVTSDIRRVWHMKLCAWAKIIDFELACTPNCERIASRMVIKRGDMQDEYGLATTRCDVFDIHLLLFDALRASTRNALHGPFASFVFAFLPEQYFLPQHLTPQCRLRVQDQHALQQKLGPMILLDMMAHPYFYQYRNYAEKADYELVWRDV